jgi:hypothetical protein
MDRYNDELMLPLYEQWKASGMSKMAFALSRQIAPNTFYYWTNKFERATALPSSGFHRIATDTLPVGTHQGELMAAIQYPSGIRLELYSSFQQVSTSYTQLLKTLTH